MEQYVAYFFKCIKFFLPPTTNSVKWAFTHVFEHMVTFFAPFLILLAVIFFIITIRSNKLTMIQCFGFFYLMTLILYAGIEQRGFVRYTFPLILPFFVILKTALNGLGRRFRFNGNKGLEYLFIFLIGFNCVHIALHFDYKGDDMYRAENQQLFQWVKKNIHDDEYYLFENARTMRRITGKLGISLWTMNMEKPIVIEELPKRLIELQIKYIIVIRSLDPGFIDLLKNNAHLTELVWENSHYTIFNFLPDHT